MEVPGAAEHPHDCDQGRSGGLGRGQPCSKVKSMTHRGEKIKRLRPMNLASVTVQLPNYDLQSSPLSCYRLGRPPAHLVFPSRCFQGISNTSGPKAKSLSLPIQSSRRCPHLREWTPSPPTSCKSDIWEPSLPLPLPHPIQFLTSLLKISPIWALLSTSTIIKTILG